MTTSKKKKTSHGSSSYIDRTQVLSNQNKLPNVTTETIAIELENKKCHNSIEKRFKYKLTQYQESDNKSNELLLDAFVMHNEICVLMFTERQKQMISNNDLSKLQFSFNDNINTNNISGKLKKGASHIKAGDIIGKVVMNSIDISEENSLYTNMEFKSPVGGQLLELNERLLLLFPSLQQNNHGRDYLAIIYPVINTLV